MQIRPHTWTDRHTHRMYHMTLSLCFGFVALIVVYGTGIAFFNAKADTSAQSPVQLSATVGEVNSGPTTVINGGGGGTYNPPLNNPPTSGVPPTANPPYVSIQFSEPSSASGSDMTYETITAADGTKTTARVFATATPAFSGLTNIADALIYIDVKSSIVDVHGTANVDANGAWAWSPTVPLASGTYVFTVVAIDPNNNQLQASATETFVVNVAGPHAPGNTGGSGGAANGGSSNSPSSNGSTSVHGPSVFITATISAKAKKVSPGSEIYVTVTFVDRESHPVAIQVPTEYKITDSKGAVVLDSTENTSFTAQISLLKSFYLSAQLPAGEYTFSALATVGGSTIETSDTFQVAGKSVVFVTQNATIDLTAIFDFLAGLFILFVFIAYMEFRRFRQANREIAADNHHDET